MKERKRDTDNSKTKEFGEEILLKFGGWKNPLILMFEWQRTNPITQATSSPIIGYPT